MQQRGGSRVIPGPLGQGRVGSSPGDATDSFDCLYVALSPRGGNEGKEAGSIFLFELLPQNPWISVSRQ